MHSACSTVQVESWNAATPELRYDIDVLTSSSPLFSWKGPCISVVETNSFWLSVTLIADLLLAKRFEYHTWVFCPALPLPQIPYPVAAAYRALVLNSKWFHENEKEDTVPEIAIHLYSSRDCRNGVKALYDWWWMNLVHSNRLLNSVKCLTDSNPDSANINGLN